MHCVVVCYCKCIVLCSRVLRVVRCFSSFATMQGVAVMLHVIMQSLPDLANIFLLLLIIMMV